MHIIFDHGVSETDHKPPVAAFEVAFDSPALLIKQFSRPRLEGWVNEFLKTSRSHEADRITTEPSRTDLRKHLDERENAKMLNASM